MQIDFIISGVGSALVAITGDVNRIFPQIGTPLFKCSNIKVSKVYTDHLFFPEGWEANNIESSRIK